MVNNLALLRRPAIGLGAGTAHQHRPFTVAQAVGLAEGLDAWGFDRCLWGTDWTRAFAVVNYEQAVEPFRLTDRLSDSERAMLMGGACAKAYDWSPKKG